MRSASVATVEILLVEDNPADVRLMREALGERGVRHRLSVVGDGEQALAFLRRRPPYEDAPRPDLVLLDLNLPRKDGREVLADMKADPALRRIPVIVVSSSTAQSDIEATYANHANCFVNKPMGLDDFVGVVQAIERFWLAVARLPSGRGPA